MSTNMAVPDMLIRMWKSKTVTLVKDRCFRGVGTVVLLASLACAQTGPTGHWEGVFTPENSREVRVTLDLAKNAKSEWIASMGVPSENLTGLVVVGVVVNDNSLKFVGVELMMAKLDLTLVPDGRMKGTISTAQSSRPIEFKRTGEAKVELVPASPAVSKELEGDWEGSMGPPNGARRLVFHFRNQPDGTVAATIGDEPGLPLNDVKQTGQKVEFGIKIGHGRFQGTLNKEGTEIAGQLTHDENSVPLTLRKK